MNKKQSGLGRGLGAILPNSTQFSEIAISTIEANPFQPRTFFEEEALHELAVSIKELGVIQPITVREMGHNKYQLISGERRMRASQLANLSVIPAYVRKATDQEMLEMALVENIQRENLNPIEVAISFKRLIEECNLTHEACSERVGKNRSTITNFLRLLSLPEEIQIGLQKNLISAGHARALLAIKDSHSQLNLYHDSITNGYSVRELEQIAKDFADKDYKRISKEKVQSPNAPISFNLQRRTHDLTHYFGCDVEIQINKNGIGKLIIPFSSEEEFEQIYTSIKNPS